MSDALPPKKTATGGYTIDATNAFDLPDLECQPIPLGALFRVLATLTMQVQDGLQSGTSPETPVEYACAIDEPTKLVFTVTWKPATEDTIQRGLLLFGDHARS